MLVLLMIILLSAVALFTGYALYMLSQKRNAVETAWKSLEALMHEKQKILHLMIGIAYDFIPREIKLKELQNTLRLYHFLKKRGQQLTCDDKSSAEAEALFETLRTAKFNPKMDETDGLYKDFVRLVEKIAFAEKFYLDLATKYNEFMIKPPYNIIANLFGYHKITDIR